MGAYAKLPIIDSAARCGIVFDRRTLGRTEVEAKCPFCGDKPDRYHLRLNTERDVYKCFLCNASGNSVSLYARLRNVSNAGAARDLLRGSNVYQMPSVPKTRVQPEREPKPLRERHAVYAAMLEHLTLSDVHRANLRGRGLSDERIYRNGYRSLPESRRSKLMLSDMLSMSHDLDGIPGFYRDGNRWSLAGMPGILIPYRDCDGMIQGLQIRLDDDNTAKRRYRWLASTSRSHGTKCGTHIHVTGNLSSDTAYITEGALKGDTASFLDGDALFVCIAGIDATGGLSDTLRHLSARSVVVALDMDKASNPRVQEAVRRISAKVAALQRVNTSVANWDVRYKGIDDYYLARRNMQTAPLVLEAAA
jgi:hypothetical protein